MPSSFRWSARASSVAVVSAARTVGQSSKTIHTATATSEDVGRRNDDISLTIARRPALFGIDGGQSLTQGSKGPTSSHRTSLSWSSDPERRLSGHEPSGCLCTKVIFFHCSFTLRLRAHASIIDRGGSMTIGNGSNALVGRRLV